MAKLGDQFEVKYGYESDTSVEGDVSKLSNQIGFSELVKAPRGK
jgi:hypothetical protein